MSELDETKADGVLMNEVQLLLAEKRTSLATLRTGIAVFALPVSVLSVLIATSKHYDLVQVLHWMIPLLAICGAMVVLGSFLVIRSIGRLHHQDRLIMNLKKKHSSIAKFIE